MKFNSEDNSYAAAFVFMVISLVIIIILAFMQTKIEKIQLQIKSIQHNIDSIQLINTYNYEHSEIKSKP